MPPAIISRSTAIVTLPPCPSCWSTVDVDDVPMRGTCFCGAQLRYRDAMTGEVLRQAEVVSA